MQAVVDKLPFFLVPHPHIQIAGVAATLALHIIDSHIINDASYLYYLLYLPYILWLHVMINFRKYYSDEANMDLHAIVSKNIKMRYMCQSS